METLSSILTDTLILKFKQYFKNQNQEVQMTDFDHSLISGGLNYTQSPIIKNGPIKNDAQILGKFKERTLSRSKLRNA